MTTKLILRKNEEHRLLSGHLWIFSNEIAGIEGEQIKGDIVELYSAGRQFLGQGFFNPSSLIIFRLLTRARDVITPEFWTERIRSAADYRSKIMGGQKSLRVVFGESDNLPGLIVDKYADVLSVQFLSAGMELNSDAGVAALRRVFNPAGIIARNDSSLRVLEGLEQTSGVLWGDVPTELEIEQDGIRFNVHPSAGQKTGFFFDQRENRRALAQYCAGKTLLDVFSYTGSFSMYALKNGAAKAVAVDSSEQALEASSCNARLNGVADRFSAVKADCFDFFSDENEKASGEKYDIIVLDPPALVKNKKHLQAGFRAYVKLNAAALSRLSPGGLLATSSCSHHLSPADFRVMLMQAAGKARKMVRLVEQRSQGRDHPVLVSMPETEYLKFAILSTLLS